MSDADQNIDNENGTSPDNQESVDIFNLSDEEFAELGDSFLEPPADEENEEQDEADEDSEDEQENSDDTDSGEEHPEDEAADDSSDSTESDEEEDDSDSGDDENADSGDSDGDPADSNDNSGQSDDSADAVDYKKEYERLTAPFKANGKEMQIDSVDDAIQLMQMGANYNRKMHDMKPAMKALKVLEKNGLLDEEKLGHLIDLQNKNPAAIAKLLKDSDIDPLQFDMEQGEGYKASKHDIPDAEIELDSVLDDLKDSEHYLETLDIVSEKWDDKSREAVRAQPELLRVIDGHLASGVYKLISTRVAKERALNRLPGMSDIDAYQKVGDAIQAEGGFDHLFNSDEQGQQDSPSPKEASADKADDSKRRSKRRAASPTKKSAPKKDSLPKHSPLALSDEEFLKQGDAKFL